MIGLSPFHRGEQLVQEKSGVRQQAEALGQRMIKTEMPLQHRLFYEQLPLIYVASLDGEGRPWASVLAGEPGFAHSPDPKHLTLAIQPPAFDPGRFAVGAKLGILGLEFETRRRNRMNGEVSKAEGGAFTVRVDQAFGNCPQFIQTRRRIPSSGESARLLARQGRFSPAMVDLLENADTFLIASVFEESGLDLSHRGGKPGFVKVENERTLLWPDFSGNNHFNTLGNITLDPRTGYLYFDLEKGALLYLTGRTEILWEHPELDSFAGAQRMLRFTLEEAVMVENTLPFRWQLQEVSPSLRSTGSFRKEVVEYQVVAKEPESRTITSFYLKPTEGATPTFHPGQHLAIEFGPARSIQRSYSLSGYPGQETLRISVKRESEGLGSRYLHDKTRVGDRLQAHPPRGTFILNRATSPVVLLAGGVGITPLLSMARASLNQGRRTWMVQAARNGSEAAFTGELRALEKQGLRLHRRFSRPQEGDRLGQDYDAAGRLDTLWMGQNLPIGEGHFYLCGPATFIEWLYRGLVELGVEEDRIHFEAFARSPRLKSHSPVRVRFEESGLESTWTSGTLLELAEDAGLQPSFGCRSGSCGACLVGLKSGKVSYREASMDPGQGVLLCSAEPAVGVDQLRIAL